MSSDDDRRRGARRMLNDSRTRLRRGLGGQAFAQAVGFAVHLGGVPALPALLGRIALRRVAGARRPSRLARVQQPGVHERDRERGHDVRGAG